MKTNEIQDALGKRYSHLHPVLFLRSVERASSDTELFDILEGIKDYPVVWDDLQRCWAKTNIFHSVFRSEEG